MRLIAVLAGCFLVGISSAFCPSNTVYNPHQNLCHKFVEKLATFLEAKKDCESQNGTLAVVISASDNQVIDGLAQQFFGRYSDFWLGGSTLETSFWKWTSSIPWGFDNFAATHNSNVSGVCLSLQLGTGRWFPSYCNATKPYVCALPSIPSEEPTTTVSPPLGCPTQEPCPTCVCASLPPATIPPPTPSSQTPSPQTLYCLGTGWTLSVDTKLCYRAFSGDYNFTGAENVCLSEGGHLASIHSEKENNLVEQSFLNQINQMNPPRSPNTWIGLIKQNGSWVWTDGTPVDYMNWGEGEPDNRHGTESCAFGVGDPVRHGQGPWVVFVFLMIIAMSDEPIVSTQEKVKEFIEKMAKEAGLEDLTDPKLAQFLSDSDALKTVRDQFHFPKCGTLPDVDASLCDPDSDSIYLCGNSLGLMPKATERIMMEQLDKWARMGVFGHLNGDLPWAYCDEAALEGVGRLVGADKGEIALCNGLTVNIHVLLAAFYNPTETRHKILMESKAFPSDHYAIESQLRLHGRTVEESMICLSPREGEDTFRTEDIIDYIEKHGDEISIVWFSGIQYYTGQLFDIKNITEAGHRKGCLVGWDLAHAFANVPLQLHWWDVDFAAWCSYKYGCTGAGGLAGLFVHERFKTDKRERMLGWWSHRMSTRFNMDNVLDLDDGAAGYRISNPPIHLVVPVMGILEVFNTVSLEDLRSRSCYLTGYLELLLKHFFGEDSDHRTSKISCSILTPSNFHERGCQLSLRFNVSIDIVYKELVKRGCAVDKRYPNVIRVTPVHLYNNYVDCRRFITALQESAAVAEVSM